MSARHLLTALVLLAALACHGLGSSAPATLLVVAVMALELWLWARILRRKPRNINESA